MKRGYQITIEGRGEGIRYREADKEYNFDLCLGERPYRILANSYWDGSMPPITRPLSEEEKTRIIPRMIAFLKGRERDAEVEVKWKKESAPLKTSWELFMERRRSRGIAD